MSHTFLHFMFLSEALNTNSINRLCVQILDAASEKQQWLLKACIWKGLLALQDDSTIKECLIRRMIMGILYENVMDAPFDSVYIFWSQLISSFEYACLPHAEMINLLSLQGLAPWCVNAWEHLCIFAIRRNVEMCSAFLFYRTALWKALINMHESCMKL